MIADASAIVPVLIDHPMTASARTALTGNDLMAPAIMFAETANALWRYSLRGGIGANETNLSLREVARLVASIPDSGLLDPAVKIAVAHGHSVYDCLYLALALQRHEPLATADGRMAALARNLGIAVVFVEPEV